MGESLKQTKMRRFWINCPSTLQPYHEHHGLVCYAPVDKFGKKAKGFVDIYPITLEGFYSMRVDSLYLAEWDLNNKNK
jgi:hypothetical protein